MSKFPLFLITLKFLLARSFDPSKIDYCNIRCREYVSTACNCEPGTDRTYVTEDMPKFRQLVLDTHNDLRNKIARGDEKEQDYEPAANMHILKYDLELEHLARCYVMWPNFTHGHDKCRQTSYCQNELHPGQNIAGISNPESGNETVLVEFMKDGWYAELKDIPTAEEKKNLMKEFQQTSYKVGHFTQMVWASTERIGCARVKIPNNEFKVYKFVLICNYAGPNENCAGNLLGTPVYEAGEPCSKCGSTKCNKELGGKYDALCGEGEKVPSNEPVSSAPPVSPVSPDSSDSPNSDNTKEDAHNHDHEGKEIEDVTPDDGINYIRKDDSKSSRNVVNGFFIGCIVIAVIINGRFE